MRLADLLDIQTIQKLAEANYAASGMPVGIIDAVDGSVLVGVGWQDICVMYHRANPETLRRCRESDDFIKLNMADRKPCQYTCRNGLRDIGVPIRVEGQHLATLFLGQFLYEDEMPDRAFFIQQAHQFGFDETAYLAALDRVPAFTYAAVENILAYNSVLAEFISDLAEAAVRRQRAESQAESLARIPEENPEPVLRMGADLTLVYANTSARCSLADLGLVLGAPAPAPFVALGRRALAGPPVQGEVTAGDRVFSVTTVAVGSDVNVYCYDITDRKRLEQELRDASRAKDDFLAMLSHELRNPLTAIRNSLYLLDHAEPAGQRAWRAKEVAGRQLGHLNRMVDDLLDVTRIVRGKVELRRTRLDMAGLVRRTGEDHRSQMELRGLDFDIKTPSVSAWVEGDETRLAQVIVNLLQNAAKFTPAGGRVTLEAVRDQHQVTVRVRDTGAGITPDLLDRIFDPFVQARQSLARTEGGLGLGLALVKGLVELHGGTVAASSAGAQQGAEFAVCLPLTAAVPEVPAGPACHEQLLSARHLKVLVVDDSRDAAESLAELLRMSGHDVLVAFNGRSAISLAEENRPDMVLCDVGLPDVSGYQVAEALRADRRFDGVPLVAISGYVQPEDRKRALDAGFSDHVPKPADPERILSLLASIR